MAAIPAGLASAQRTPDAADAARDAASGAALSLSPARLRIALLAGVAASAGIAALLAEPSAVMRADPDLAFVMRGMAAVKGLLVLAALGLLLWRFGRPLSRGFAVAYLAGAWLMAAATTLIGLLAVVPLAAVAFHAGEFALLIAAWRDVREPR